MTYFKPLWITYLDEIRPDLSSQSKQLYANQLNKIQHHNSLKKFDVSAFIHTIADKAMKDKNLEFVTLDGSDQAKNQRLSALRNVLEASKEIMKDKKYNNLYDLISSVGEVLREKIQFDAGENKTKKLI